jgi:acetoin utilization deacetylase AcuC-like enzyme
MWEAHCLSRPAPTQIPSTRMGVTRSVGVVQDPRFREHRGPEEHPEAPERLVAVEEAIARRSHALSNLAPRAAGDEEILRIHRRAYLESLSAAVRRAPTQLDPDTYASPQSLEVARLAAGGSIDLARAIARGDLTTGLAAVRPPGHHAEAHRAMGFCLFNNVAIAAAALRAEEGVERILILDWDVHHGNGTQRSFEEDPNLLYFSTHQYPFYPGSGAVDETGSGRGEGATVNVPLPAGCNDSVYVGVLQRILVPVTLTFRPEVLLVSAGFDAHRDDPLGGMRVSGDGFAAMAAMVRRLADEVCGGRLAHFLEGGYSFSGLRQGTGAVLDASLDPEARDLPPPVEAPSGSLLGQLVGQVVAVHGDRYRGLGAS